MNTPVFYYLLQYPHPIDSTQRPLSHIEKHTLPRNHPVNINRRNREARVRALLLKNFCLPVSKELISLCESFRHSDNRVKIRIKTVQNFYLLLSEKSKFFEHPLTFRHIQLVALKYCYINSSKSVARKNVR